MGHHQLRPRRGIGRGAPRHPPANRVRVALVARVGPGAASPARRRRVVSKRRGAHSCPRARRGTHCHAHRTVCNPDGIPGSSARASASNGRLRRSLRPPGPLPQRILQLLFPGAPVDGGGGVVGPVASPHGRERHRRAWDKCRSSRYACLSAETNTTFASRISSARRRTTHIRRVSRSPEEANNRIFAGHVPRTRAARRAPPQAQDGRGRHRPRV